MPSRVGLSKEEGLVTQIMTKGMSSMAVSRTRFAKSVDFTCEVFLHSFILKGSLPSLLLCPRSFTSSLQFPLQKC